MPTSSKTSKFLGGCDKCGEKKQIDGSTTNGGNKTEKKGKNKKTVKKSNNNK